MHAGRCGPKFVTCERLGPFTGRSTDIGVVLDLMIHDLDLLLALVPSPVRAVQALGLSVLGGHEDVAQARLVFENGCVANLSASRVSAGAGAAHAGVGGRRASPAWTSPAVPSPLPSRAQTGEPRWQVLELDRNQGDQLTGTSPRSSSTASAAGTGRG